MFPQIAGTSLSVATGSQIPIHRGANVIEMDQDVSPNTTFLKNSKHIQYCFYMLKNQQG